MAELSPSVRAIAKGSIVLFIGLLLSKGLTYIYRMIVARYLGAQEYGTLALALAILNFMFILSNAGLTGGITRYVSYFREKGELSGVKGVITTTLKVVIPLSTGIATILFYFSDAISAFFDAPIGFSPLLKVVIVALPFWALLRIMIQIFYAFKKVEYAVSVEYLFQSIVLVIGTIIFVSAGYGVIGAAVAFSLSVVVSSGLAIYLLEKKVFPILKTMVISAKVLGELFRYSFPLFLEAFVSVIIKNTDTIMLGYFLTMREVGIYNAVMPTADILLIFPALFIPVYFPILTELYSSGKSEEFRATVKTISRWIFLLTLPFFLTMLIFPSQILSILFGTEYALGGRALLILSFGVFLFVVLGNVNRPIPGVYKLTKYLLYITTLMSLFNIIANYMLIPKFGVEGAAAATSMSYSIGAVAYFILGYRITGRVSVSRDFIKIFFSGLISITVTFLLLEYLFRSRTLGHMIIFFIVFFSLYLGALIIFKSYKDEDVAILIAIKNKIINP